MVVKDEVVAKVLELETLVSSTATTPTEDKKTETLSARCRGLLPDVLAVVVKVMENWAADKTVHRKTETVARCRGPAAAVDARPSTPIHRGRMSASAPTPGLVRLPLSRGQFPLTLSKHSRAQRRLRWILV